MAAPHHWQKSQEAKRMKAQIITIAELRERRLARMSEHAVEEKPRPNPNEYTCRECGWPALVCTYGTVRCADCGEEQKHLTLAEKVQP
jgi:hypothetical protein